VMDGGKTWERSGTERNEFEGRGTEGNGTVTVTRHKRTKHCIIII